MKLEVILGLLRHLLTFGGGALASSGLMEASQVDTAVGAIITVVGVVLSIVHKAQAKAPAPTGDATPPL